MGDFIKHEPCPDCGSRDNVAVYDDGKYCFGCGWYQSKGKIESFVHKKEQLTLKGVDKTKTVLLPSDIKFDIPLIPRAWLRKYGITEREIKENRFCWSDRQKYLIFPVYNSVGDLVFWQARVFKQMNLPEGTVKRPDPPKYITIGQKDDYFHIIGEKEELKTLVLVEDMLSAIKVSRVAPSMPLFGSTLSDERAMRLSQRYQQVILWLDKDKWTESLQYSNRFKYIFDKFGIVSTKEDPKELDITQIKKQLHWHLGD